MWQVNRWWAGDAMPCLHGARFSCLCADIAVKLPVTAAGLVVLESAAQGITVTAT
jgi:hypothetical protein